MSFIGSVYRNMRRFISAKKRWDWPRHSEVLIFDACNHAPLLPLIGHLRPVILSIRWEEINIPILLASLFRRGKPADAYIDAFIEAVDPKIIITFIDNTPAFYRLKSRHPHRITIFVQNGWRTYEADVFEHLDTMGSGESLSVDYMVCFNDSVAALYQRYINGNSVVIGSLKNNTYSSRYSFEPGTIAYISQWVEEGFHLGERFYSQEEFGGQVDRLILPVLQEQTQRRAAPLYIIPRTAPDSPKRQLEEVHFKSMLGGSCRFLEYPEPGSSYQAIDSVEVVVGVDSTLVYESLARGNKTAVFAIRAHMLGVQSYRFGWPMDCPNEGAFWTNVPDCGRFKTILDSLFSLSKPEWKKAFEESKMQELMAYDPDNKKLVTLLEKLR